MVVWPLPALLPSRRDHRGHLAAAVPAAHLKFPETPCAQGESSAFAAAGPAELAYNILI
jgi:hypothetical protein